MYLAITLGKLNLAGGTQVKPFWAGLGTGWVILGKYCREGPYLFFLYFFLFFAYRVVIL